MTSRTTKSELVTMLEAERAHTGRQLVEGIEQVRQMFLKEDEHWLKLQGSLEDEHGLSLEDLQHWSEEIRTAIAGNPHIKRGLKLRTANILQGGITYAGIEAGRGRKNVQKCIDHPVNQRNFFGPNAREEREAALYSECLALYRGEESTKLLTPTPIWEIGATYRNPEDSSEVWAYRREWTNYNEAGDGKGGAKRRWYFTDIYVDKRPKPGKSGKAYLGKGADRVEVDLEHIIFDGMVNTQIGWPFGVPDALSALIWSRKYRDFLTGGMTMSDALAQFAFQAVTESQEGAKGVSAQMAAPVGPGATAAGSVSLQPMSSAGKGYDFDSGRAIISVVATALEVSVIALSSDPGTAGSSYGSASTLDLPTRLAVEARRQWHVEFDLRVLRWMGAKDATASFDSLDDFTDIFRRIQAFLLKWSTGLYGAQETKDAMEAAEGKIATKVPEGVMLPNNEKSLNRSDIDADGEPVSATPSGQGKNSPAGQGQNANDIRSEMLQMMEMVVQLGEAQGLDLAAQRS